MPPRDNSKEAYDIGQKIGELTGTQNAMLAALASIDKELTRMEAERQRQHDENVRLIARRHEENTNLILEHKDEDDKNFFEVRKLCWMIVYTFVGSSFTVGIIWTLFQFVFPLMKK